MLFPDFTGVRSLDWLVFANDRCKAWRKKIPERSEDDFFPANRPKGGPPCTKNAIQDLCLVKTEKHRPLLLISELFSLN